MPSALSTIHRPSLKLSTKQVQFGTKNCVGIRHKQYAEHTIVKSWVPCVHFAGKFLKHCFNIASKNILTVKLVQCICDKHEVWV